MSDHDFDLKSLLDHWPYEPGSFNARIISGQDDQPRIQVRIELGVLQMELRGRPDGQRPEGHENLLEMHQHRLKWYIEQTGSEVGFVLTPEECRAIREETVQYYHRYVALFGLGDYAGVIADTEHNLAVLDMCRAIAAEPDDRVMMEQFRPAVVTMRTRAQAEMSIAAEQPREALAAIDRGLDELRRLFEEAGAADAWEQSNEVQLLRGMRDVLVPKLPAGQRTELQERLQAALDAENYELAAILRDELRLLGY